MAVAIEKKKKSPKKKEAKNERIVGRRLVFEDVETGEETTCVLRNEHTLYSVLSDNRGWDKTVSCKVNVTLTVFYGFRSQLV